MLPSLLWSLLVSGASAGLPTVVSFDNGEFNTPLYTPRWNGQWKQPSAAQELATAVARVLGENPDVYTYMPPGNVPARSGHAHRVRPKLQGCDGPSESPDDACWCSPADNCWGGLGPNYHGAGSSSLYLTATNLREQMPEGEPYVELHFTDLFEEDPSAAEDQADSDRCVTQSGVRRALAGLVRSERSIDHVIVGALRATIDPPPPGGSWGNVYRFEPVEEGSACHSGVKTGDWSAKRGAHSMVFGVVMLGIETEGHQEEIASLVDGLMAQLDSEELSLAMVSLAEPPERREVADGVRAERANPWGVPPSPRKRLVPCESVMGSGEFVANNMRVPTPKIDARCDGGASVTFPPDLLQRAFVRHAGLNPSIRTLELSGMVMLEGDDGVQEKVRAVLEPLNEGARPLPLLGALTGWKPVDRGYRSAVEVTSLRISGLDGRPWILAGLAGAALGICLGGIASWLLRRNHANQAMRAAWDRSLGPGHDALVQRPMAAIIAEAQEAVHRQWVLRLLVGLATALTAGIGGFGVLMQLYVVLRG